MNVFVFGQEERLEEQQWRRFKLGELDFILLKYDGEWRCAKNDNIIIEEIFNGEMSSLPHKIDWKRMDCSNEDSKFVLKPVFPSLPLIATPNNPLLLAPNRQAEFFVGIPASVELHVSCGGTLTLMDTLQTLQLSKTWHGTQLNGELCYTLKTRALRHYADELFPREDIICQMTVLNKCDQTFVIDHLYLPVKNFEIFRDHNRLWSSSAKIDAESTETEKNHLYIGNSAGPHAPNAVKVHSLESGLSKIRIVRAFTSIFTH